MTHIVRRADRCDEGAADEEVLGGLVEGGAERPIRADGRADAPRVNGEWAVCVVGGVGEWRERGECVVATHEYAIGTMPLLWQ